MRRFAAAVCLSISAAAFAAPLHAGAANAGAALLPGLGNLHHPVSTKSPEAQRFFDQGLVLTYAFNHGESIRAFQRAADLDPGLAMAYWGIALANGPNINSDIDPEREKAAVAAIGKARALDSRAPQNEQRYIDALARRYSTDPKADLHGLAVDYSRAMRDLTRAYPDDLDAATLYAESLMDLRPWRLWSHDGKPAEGTEEIVAVLESILKRDPNHIGANHYYIHAVEASPHPEKALMSAKRLETLAPAAGHLVHMPAHIYIQTGDYDAAARQNERAVGVDLQYLKAHGSFGMYPLYYLHNLDFLRAAYSMEGRYRDALRVANELAEGTRPHLEEMPFMEGAMAIPTLIMVRGARWDDLLRASAPGPGMPITAAFRRFGRGMALAATGRLDRADAEQKAFRAAVKRVPAGAMWNLNSAAAVRGLAGDLLAARIAWARGDHPAAIARLRQAVVDQDALNYDEPQDWFYPVRESLGAALFLNHDPKAAEAVFRADLDRNPGNGRSLFGLFQCLKAEGRTADAAMVQRRFDEAWRRADGPLRIEDL